MSSNQRSSITPGKVGHKQDLYIALADRWLRHYTAHSDHAVRMRADRFHPQGRAIRQGSRSTSSGAAAGYDGVGRVVDEGRINVVDGWGTVKRTFCGEVKLRVLGSRELPLVCQSVRIGSTLRDGLLRSWKIRAADEKGGSEYVKTLDAFLALGRHLAAPGNGPAHPRQQRCATGWGRSRRPEG
jgi:hypothetical protein